MLLIDRLLLDRTRVPSLFETSREEPWLRMQAVIRRTP